MADKRITELTNEKLILGDGDYTIVDSNEGTYKYKLKRIMDAIPAIDDSLSHEGQSADAKATGDEIADVKRDLENAEVFEPIPFSSANFQQGWYGATTGVYDSSHTNAICLIDDVGEQSFIELKSNYKMRIHAWEGTTYKGIWNGSTFATVNPDYYITSFNVKKFKANYSTYYFKIVVYKSDGTSNIAPSDAINVISLYAKMSELESAISHLESVGYLVNAEWEMGTISGSTGTDSPSDTRTRLKGFLSADEFFSYENFEIYRTILFAYDRDKIYLGRCHDGFSEHYYNRNEALTLFPTAKFFRILFENSDVTVSAKTKIYGNKVAENAFTGAEYATPNGGDYFGERIDIGRNKCEYVQMPYASDGQDAVCGGGYVFGCNTSGTLSVRDESSGYTVKSITLDTDGITPHCNSSVWGNKYSENDAFPLLYINAYDAPNADNGVCYVHRITDTNGVPNTPTTLVQTIFIGFADTEPWTDGNDIRPYGNFFVDTDHGFLYAYTLKDNLNVTRFFKFNLPSLSESNVILNTADIIEQFDVPYMPYIQGNTYHDGKAYILSGMPSDNKDGKINVVNLLAQKIVTEVNLTQIGLTTEPEFVFIKDGYLNAGTYWANKFKF